MHRLYILTGSQKTLEEEHTTEFPNGGRKYERNILSVRRLLFYRQTNLRVKPFCCQFQRYLLSLLQSKFLRQLATKLDMILLRWRVSAPNPAKEDGGTAIPGQLEDLILCSVIRR